MNSLLKKLNRYGYKFTRDFMLKVCLTLLDMKAQYEVKKFREPGVRENIQKNWPKISDAVRSVLDFVRKNTFVRSDKALHSYLGLIPLIYFRFKYPENWENSQDIEKYLLRILLSRAFSGTPDQLINECVDNINEHQQFNVNGIFEIIRSQNRSLELTEDSIWNIGYGSGTIHLIFSLWYKGFEYQPVSDENLPQIDHIFPQSMLMKVKYVDSISKRKKQRYDKPTRNQLANCMLLSREENGAGGKGNIPPNEWFSDKSEEYLDLHLIPKDPNLWEIERFDDFIEERKNLIRRKFPELFAKNVRD